MAATGAHGIVLMKVLARRDRAAAQATQHKYAALIASGRLGKTATPKMAGTAAAIPRQHLVAVLTMTLLLNTGIMGVQQAHALTL